MIKITKDPRDVRKNFKCRRCGCEFTAEYKDAENFVWILEVKCPICGKEIDWTDGEEDDLPKPELMTKSGYNEYKGGPDD